MSVVVCGQVGSGHHHILNQLVCTVCCGSISQVGSVRMLTTVQVDLSQSFKLPCFLGHIKLKQLHFGWERWFIQALAAAPLGDRLCSCWGAWRRRGEATRRGRAETSGVFSCSFQRGEAVTLWDPLEATQEVWGDWAASWCSAAVTWLLAGLLWICCETAAAAQPGNLTQKRSFPCFCLNFTVRYLWGTKCKINVKFIIQLTFTTDILLQLSHSLDNFLPNAKFKC